ncbi:MAG: RDD family protein [Candidatus Stygibacter australis]|nr:RDD family protein [Candidatus Stygibacter australis]MDP8320829.1 RDD family protein [Candidatus Stygibacter australis]
MSNTTTGFGFGMKRLAAFIIDFILLFCIYLMAGDAVNGKELSLIILFTVLIIPAVYLIIFWVLAGATPGMLIFRLRMRKIQTGKKPNLLTAVWRFIIFLISLFSFFLGFLWQFWDSRHQTWADKLSGCMIVNKGQDIQESESAADQKKWRVGKILFSISTLIFVIFNMVIQYTEPLLPDTESWLIDYSTEANPEDNGYYQLICFAAGSDEDPFERGYRSIQDANEFIMDYYRLREAGKKRDEFAPQPDLSCKLDIDSNTLISIWQAEDFYNALLADQSFIKSNMDRFSYLQKRYYQIADYPYISTRLFPDIAVISPPLIALVNYHRLFLSNVCLEYLTGDKDEAIDMLLKTFDITNRMLEESDSMIMKLTSSVLMQLSQDTCQKMLNYKQDFDPSYEKLLNGIPALSWEALSFRNAYVYEYNIEASYTVSMLDSPYGFLDYKVDLEDIRNANPPLLKASQIINFSLRAFKQYIAISELPYPQFAQEISNPSLPKPHFIEYFNNTVGVALEMSRIDSVYYRYLVMVRDLELKSTMLRAAASIKHHEIASSDVQLFLDNNKDKWYNLYSDEPFNWDEASQEISFTGPMPEEFPDKRKLKLSLD